MVGSTLRSQYGYIPATIEVTAVTLIVALPAPLNMTPGRAFFIIDRKQDTLGRSTGWTLGAPTSPSALETQATYSYNASTGRLAQVSNPLISSHQFTYGYESGSSLIASITGPAHTVTNTWETTRNVLDTKGNEVGSTVISPYDSTVNAIGQRSKVTTSGTAFPATPSWAWGYDSLGHKVNGRVETPDGSRRLENVIREIPKDSGQADNGIRKIRSASRPARDGTPEIPSNPCR